jgi:lysophospholipase L1-like esterase
MPLTGPCGQEDPHLHHVDGRDLSGPADHDLDPLPDRLHPSPAGHRRIADRFSAVLDRLVPFPAG